MRVKTAIAGATVPSFVALVFCFPTPSDASQPGRQPITIRVPADQPTIQAAIDLALDKDTVLVADGVYTGPGNREIDFSGKKITVRSENGAATTIIDCEHFGRGFEFRNGETNLSKLIGFTIENGQEVSGGGAILTVGTSPVISRCVFRNNLANIGGAVYVTGGSPKIMNCMIVDNLAETFGGGDGGGIQCQGSDATIVNCTIANNHATGEAGGVVVTGSQSDVTIANSILFGNTSFHPLNFDQLLIRSNNTVQIDFCDIQGGEAEIDVEGTLIFGIGNIDQDPSFVDALNGDFHLSDESPCIERGDPLYVPPGLNATDVDGDVRVFGTIVDMGADEFASCGDIFRTYFPAALPLAIPDNSLAGLLVPVEVPDFGTTTFTVAMNLNITHPDPDDLVLVLHAPGCDPGDSCGFLMCTSPSFPCSFPALFVTGTFFEDVPIHGTWTLQVIDRVAGNTGSVTFCRLEIFFTICF